MTPPAGHACASTAYAGFPRHAVESTIPGRLAAVAREHAECVAIVDGSRQTTYAELWQRSVAIAQALRAEGVARGEPVPVLADQSAPAVIALVGVSLAGGAFAPLDVLDPPARARSLVELVGGRLVVTTSARLDEARKIAGEAGRRLPVMDADDVPRADETGLPEPTPDDPASIFFTSGSTGAPKAVVDVHRNVLHNAHRYTTLLRISPADRLSVVQRPSFSGIASSVFGALLNGATLCTFALTGENATALAAWVERNEITVFHSVPAIFRVLTAGGGSFPHVRVVRLEGDRATWDDVERFRRYFRPGAILANGLGTTETGLASQYRLTHATPPGSGILPVGRPAPDMETLVLDDRLEPVRDGVVGEIAVRSRFLASGYLGSPELTDARFLRDHERSDVRTYLTGDLGRVGHGGVLEVLGRRDGGAKVGGVRVEPAEVERAILSLELARDARVRVEGMSSGAGVLSAVVVPTGETTADEIRSGLVRMLPIHMIPARIELAQDLATDANWKVRASDRGRRRPHAGLEDELTAIWAEVLETDVGLDDLFVELGGDSLAAAEVAAAIEGRLGRELPVGILSRAATVAELAAALESRDCGTGVSVVPLAGAGTGTPLILLPDHRGDPLMFAEVARGLDAWCPVWGVALGPELGRDLSIPSVADSVVSELRAARPEGPYHILGYCYGALLTIEVTRRLRDAGDDVRPILLGLLPADLETVVSPDALRRWHATFGPRALGLTRMSYHARRAFRRNGVGPVAYLSRTVRQAMEHYAARLHHSPPPSLKRGARGYRPATLAGLAHLVLAEDTVVAYASDAQAAWGGIADEVDVRLVPGSWTDSQLLRAPGSAVLAAALADVLQTEP